MKRIHGVPEPLWQKLGLQEKPPADTDSGFAIGDRVIFTNDYGLKFDMDIIGFSESTSFYGRFIHLVRHKQNESGSAWWFPHLPSELKKVAS